MSIYSEHAAALAELQAEQGADCPAIWFNGALIKVLPGSASLRTENGIGGDGLFYDLQFTALLADFGGVIPESNAPFNYPGQNGDAYKISSVQPAPGQFQIRIKANSASEGGE
jgi:hypothetical protein